MFTGNGEEKALFLDFVLSGVTGIHLESWNTYRKDEEGQLLQGLFCQDGCVSISITSHSVRVEGRVQGSAAGVMGFAITS